VLSFFDFETLKSIFSEDGSLAIEIIVRKIKILVKQNKIIGFYFKLLEKFSKNF
jgi:hypothetical protein